MIALTKKVVPANGLDIRSFVSGTGTTVTEVAFNAALAAMDTSGGRLILPGNVPYLLSAPVVLSKRVEMVGWGKAAMYRTQVGTAIKLNGDFDGFVIQKAGTRLSGFHVAGLSPLASYGATGSVSRGIVVDIQESVAFLAQYGLLPGSYIIDHVSTFNVRDGIWQENGQEGQISYCDAQQFSRYGLVLKNTLLHDGGDMSIVGCNFYPDQGINAVAGVYQTEGGGAKFTSNKWNQRTGGRMDYCYLGETSGSTSIVQFEGTNSMENFSKTGIKMTSAGFRLVQIHGVEFAPYADTATACIDINGVSGLQIGGNVFVKAASANLKGLKLRSCSVYTINPNTYVDFSAPSAGQDVDGSNSQGRNFDTDAVGTSAPPPGTSQPTPPETTFTDNFGTPGGTYFRWYDQSQGAGKITSNNGLTMQPGVFAGGTDANRAQYFSALTYDMRGRTLVANIAAIGNHADPGAPAFWMGVGAASNRKDAANVAIAVQGDMVYCEIADASVYVSLAYDSNAMKYFRMRFAADGGTFYAEYSANNSAWTTMWTKTITANMAAAKILLFSAQSYTDTVRQPTVLTSLTLA